MVNLRLTKLTDKVDALSAVVAGPSGFGMRLGAILRSLWRRVIPLPVREPMHRYRRRLLATLRRGR
jgi:hypothetical protein